MRIKFSLFILIAVASWIVVANQAAMAQSKPLITIAVLKHLDEYFTEPLDALYVEELRALLGSDFKLEVVEYRAGWSAEEVNAVIDEIYADGDVDALLVLGFAANQRAIQRNSFDIPTFLPFVIVTAAVHRGFSR